MKRLSIAVAALALALPSSLNAETLHLICMGEGSASKIDQVNAHANDNSGNTANATVYRNRDVPFSDEMSIDIDGQSGRVRVPRVMLPPFHGAKEGWFDIEKLMVDDREITGNAAINFMNSPKLRIDRITGTVSMSGRTGSFAGQCKPYEPATVQRAF